MQNINGFIEGGFRNSLSGPWTDKIVADMSQGYGRIPNSAHRDV
jgi:hypothetical protein